MFKEDDADVFRGRAMQARLGAKEATSAAHRAVFEKLAASYEEMARNAEWLGGGDQPAGQGVST